MIEVILDVIITLRQEYISKYMLFTHMTEISALKIGKTSFINFVILSKILNFLGCTPKGYFGSNCSLPCPDVNCQECHIESGICHVCKQGYTGHHCETGTAFIFR